MRNTSEVSFTEDGVGAGKAIFEVMLKYSSSEARKNFYSTASAFQIEEDRSEFPSTK